MSKTALSWRYLSQFTETDRFKNVSSVAICRCTSLLNNSINNLCESGATPCAQGVTASVLDSLYINEKQGRI